MWFERCLRTSSISSSGSIISIKFEIVSAFMQGSGCEGGGMSGYECVGIGREEAFIPFFLWKVF